MSYILDALRKSERERQTGQVPGLPNLVADSPKTPPRWVFWLVGLLLSFNVAGLSYWLFTRPEASKVVPGPASTAMALPAPATTSAARADQATTPPIVNPGLPASPPVPAVVMPAQSVPSAPVIVPATAPPPAVVTQPSVQPPAPIPSPVMPNPVPVMRPEPPMALVPPEAIPHAVAPPPAAKAQPRPGRRKSPADVAPEALYPSEVPSRQSRSTQRPLPRPAPYTRADAMDDAEVERETEEEMMASTQNLNRMTEPLAAGRSGRNGIPYLRELPLGFQERIPPIKITMFAYARNPAERFVIIDMKKHRVGDQIPGGALLLEIQAENLLLELEGQKFLLPRY